MLTNTVRGYNYLKSFFIETNTSKLPLVFKLYPKTFSVFLLLITALAPFAGGSAAQLVRTNFSEEEWDPYRPFLEKCALSGITYLGWFVVYDTGNLLFTMFGNVFGNNDAKAAIQLMKKLDQVDNAIMSLKNEYLLNSLQRRPEQKRLTLLNGMSSTRYKQLTFFTQNTEAQHLVNTAHDDREEVTMTEGIGAPDV